MKLKKQKSWQKKLVRAFLLLCSVVFILLADIYRPVTGVQQTEILWDSYGIPHIYGKNSQSLFRAFGWAQMESHGNLLLRLYGQARGEAAEYWGENYLDSDLWVQTMGIPVRARRWYNAQRPIFRRYLNAFAAGINAYAREHPERIDDSLEMVLPVSAVDVLAHIQRVVQFTFVVNPQTVASLTEQWQNSTETSEVGTPTEMKERVWSRQPLGSNAWAIAPSRSNGKNAMLLANPHLPWSDLFLWYEAQLKAPGIDAYGASLVGIPVLTIAFNDYLGWTHTVNIHDGWDAYELKLANEGYEFDNRVRPFKAKTQTINVRQADGTLRPEQIVVQRSVHGPVVARKNDKAIAIRVVGLDQPGVLEQWWDMARAKNLTEFETALKRLQLPTFTVMYADREGHIMHLFNGQVPVRSQGDFEYWSGIIPGDTSSTLWTKNHPYRDLPRVLDPPSGWLHNANDPPWTTTLPAALTPDDYPSYMSSRGPIDFRAQRSARLLAEDEQISFEEMLEYKHSTRAELADRLLDDLIPAARERGGELAQKAADVLKVWDRQTNADSRGAVLFSFWERAMDESKLFAIPWNEKDPIATPDGLADPTGAVAVLENVAARMNATYGTLDLSWGEVFRLRYADLDLPANGGGDELGIFRSLWFVPSEDGKFEALGGDSYVAAIEFSDPVRAMVLMSYGNATQPESPHIGDQLQLFVRQELRPVWRTRQEIETHLANREVF